MKQLKNPRKIFNYPTHLHEIYEICTPLNTPIPRPLINTYSPSTLFNLASSLHFLTPKHTKHTIIISNQINFKLHLTLTYSLQINRSDLYRALDARRADDPLPNLRNIQ